MRDELGDNSNTCRLFEVHIDLVKTKIFDEVIYFVNVYCIILYDIAIYRCPLTKHQLLWYVQVNQVS